MKGFWRILIVTIVVLIIILVDSYKKPENLANTKFGKDILLEETSALNLAKTFNVDIQSNKGQEQQDEIVKENSSKTSFEDNYNGLQKEMNLYSKQVIKTDYGIVQSIGKVDSDYINTVEENLKFLPSFLVDSFMEHGWEIYVTTEDIAHTYFDDKYLKVRAVTMYTNKEILIEDREEAVGLLTVAHEFGHYLDDLNGTPSWSDEFYEIYEEEVETFKSQISNSSCVSNEQEFFAETYGYLVVDPSKCTPRAAMFVQSILKQSVPVN